ncbi:hypothetical protein PHLCEN_2v9575 [Hermanssonia centrifuga]|uniref:Uncharacterized protein n=1 Tax=Hermanssonia centrifuga TaxID=98765 RepID=A0A2R6NR70_9APHY|nr:hypothetical protein PHLCEN_2v9575 [Hermanssonia centrifuga]
MGAMSHHIDLQLTVALESRGKTSRKTLWMPTRTTIARMPDILGEASAAEDWTFPPSMRVRVAKCWAPFALDAEMASKQDSEDVSDDESVSDGSDDGERVGCNSVQDVLITGESARWQRLAKFDGLVALITSRDVQIFRDCIIRGGKTWIGNWRALATDVSPLLFEGPFIASRFETPARTTT